MYDHVYYSKQTTNKPREHVDGQFGVRENSNYALTGTRHFIGTKLIHGLQSWPPSPKRAERKLRRRPFREAGSGQNNGTR